MKHAKHFPALKPKKSRGKIYTKEEGKAGVLWVSRWNVLEQSWFSSSSRRAVECAELWRCDFRLDPWESSSSSSVFFSFFLVSESLMLMCLSRVSELFYMDICTRTWSSSSWLGMIFNFVYVSHLPGSESVAAGDISPLQVRALGALLMSPRRHHPRLSEPLQQRR